MELSKGKKAFKNKWVFNLKKDNNKLIKCKACLVVKKSFGQKQGIYFDEIFSLIIKMSFIRVILGLTTSLNLELEQLDVQIVFLYADCVFVLYINA